MFPHHAKTQHHSLGKHWQGLPEMARGGDTWTMLSMWKPALWEASFVRMQAISLEADWKDMRSATGTCLIIFWLRISPGRKKTTWIKMNFECHDDRRGGEAGSCCWEHIRWGSSELSFTASVNVAVHALHVLLVT